MQRRLPCYGTMAEKKDKNITLYLLYMQQVWGSLIVFLSAIVPLYRVVFLLVFISALFSVLWQFTCNCHPL